MSERPGLTDCIVTPDGRVLPVATPPADSGPADAPESGMEAEAVAPEPAPPPPPCPWPSEPTASCILFGKVLAAVWEDAHGVRRVAYRADGGPLTSATMSTAKVERLGVPPGWREAAERLPQDCGCVVHRGPCWLHLDFLDRESNARLLWPAGEMTIFAFAEAEAARLRTLAYEMERRGIERLTTFLGLAHEAQTTTPERAGR